MQIRVTDNRHAKVSHFPSFTRPALSLDCFPYSDATRSVICYFQTKKISKYVYDPESDDKVVASDVPPRYLLTLEAQLGPHLSITVCSSRFCF